MVCRLQYIYGKTQAEIAAILGCSQAEVTRLHLKALEFLSEPYDADGKVNQATWRHRPSRKKVEPNLAAKDGEFGHPDRIRHQLLSPEFSSPYRATPKLLSPNH